MSHQWKTALIRSFILKYLQPIKGHLPLFESPYIDSILGDDTLKSSIYMFNNSPNLIRFQLKSPILTNNLINTFRRPTNLYLNGAIGTITFGASLDNLTSCPNLVGLRLGNEPLRDDVNPLFPKHLQRSELKGVKIRRIPGDAIITKDSDEEFGDEI